MKYFLAHFEIQDGDHEHNGWVILTAKTLEEAEEIATSEEHTTESEANKETGERTYFDYGDGQTIATLESVQPITKQQANDLKLWGISNIL